MLDSQVKAPLEYPLGPIDIVSEFLIFHAIPEKKVAAEAIRTALGRQVPSTKVQLVQENAMCLVGADDDKGLAKVLLRPDGAWQLWPSHGQAPFSRLAPAVLQAAECIHAEVRGQIQFRGRPFEKPLRRDVRSRVDALSVDFFSWTQASAAAS